MTLPPADILALDLEGTLVSNAVSVIPRPGLRAFLDAVVGRYREVVIYSSVSPDRVRAILRLLDSEDLLPPGFASVEIVHPGDGSLKDLERIGDPEAILLVDDMPTAVPSQEHRLYRIPAFDHPYPARDRVLLDLTAAMVG